MSECKSAVAVNCSRENMGDVIGIRRAQKILLLREKFQKERELIKVRCMVKLKQEAALKKIFPVEIWAKIFSFVKDPVDVYNLSKTCPFFYDIVKNQTPLVLLPEVLSILRERQYVDKSDKISRIRRVSKWFSFSYAWTYFEKRFLEENWPIQYDERNATYEFGTLNFYFEKLEQFMETFGSSPIPKVWTRSIDIAYYKKSDEHDETLERFLALFGSSIWSLKVIVDSLRLSEFYTRLHTWATHLPNLRVLMIKSYDDEPLENALVRLDEIYDRNDLHSLQVVPAFPVIPTLRVFKGGKIPFSLFTEKIMESNPWIEHLNTIPRFEEDASSKVLKGLEIDVFDNRPNIYLHAHFNPLLQVYASANCHWPLRKIILRLCSEHFKATDLFRFLEEFKTTLELVWLGFEFGRYGRKTEVPEDVSLDLPKVKQFTFDYFRSYFPFRILNSMTSLEKLDLSVLVLDREWVADPYSNGSIDFYPCYFGNHMKDCNIWKHFPSLMELSFELCVNKEVDVYDCVRTKFEKKGGDVYRVFFEDLESEWIPWSSNTKCPMTN